MSCKSVLLGAKLTVRFYCSYKPLKKSGRSEPLNGYVICEIPITSLSVDSDPCGRYGDSIYFSVECLACGRNHEFDLLSLLIENRGLDEN